MELSIALAAGTGVPLHLQLYEELRLAIVAGRLARGTRLPSTRSFAKSLGVSRSTVTSTFAQLQSEGYLEATSGSGTFVSLNLPYDALPGQPRLEDAAEPAFALSTYAKALARTQPLESPREPGAIDFRDGRPAFDRFPFDTWRRLLARYVRPDRTRFDYSADPAGYPELRTAIAAYLGRARAVDCSAADVIVVTGSQQAIDLTARLLIEPGDVVALEDPGYPGATRTFAAHGAELRGIPVDGDGMQVERLIALPEPVRLVYVTPSHQFPMGSVLSLSRRVELLRWATRTGVVVVEDDYDSAYRYEGRPIPALQGLGEGSRVVYVGTFSKTMFPALRIGYVVLPRGLRDVFAQAKGFSDRQSPILEQCALADFLREGHFERHLRRMRALYRERRHALLDALARHVGQDIEVLGDSAGMHVLVRLPGPPSLTLPQRARQAGVSLMRADSHYLGAGGLNEFIFGFAELDERQIEEGVRRFGIALRQ